jgi:hypothetical protein
VPVLCTDRDYDLKKLPDKLKEAVESVCVALDRMGVLVLKGLIPEDVAFSMYFDVVLRIWYLVGPFVKQEQKNRRPGVWMKHFEVLSKGTLGYPRRIPGIGRASGTGGCA